MIRSSQSCRSHSQRSLSLCLLTLLLISAPAHAEDECSNPQSHGTMVKCASNDQLKLEAVLNSKYNDVLNKLPIKKNLLADWPEVRKQFVQGQKGWLSFRKHDCAALFVANGLGQMRVLDELGCINDRTTKRINELNEWIKWLDQMSTELSD